MKIHGDVLRAALYVRVSTEEQKVHGLSVDAQMGALNAWAQNNSVKVVDRYNDAGISARKKYNKRPELLRLLLDVQARKIDLIVFTKLDRWFRNISEYYKVQEILEANDVNWKTIHEDYDTSNASGRLKINIMLSVAQDEADRDSERIKVIFKSKREKGEPVTGCVPTGYLVRDKKMVKDEEWEEAISAFFETFSFTHSIKKSREHVLQNFEKEISYQLANALLKKTAYYGYFNEVAGICPAYITKEQYEKNQALRKHTERYTAFNRTYLFTGLIYCGECGNRFQSFLSRYHRKDGGITEHPCYNCPGTYARSNCSNHTNIREKYVEDFLLQNIEDVFRKYEMDIAQEPSNETQTILKEEITALKRKVSKLKDLYVNDLIDIEAYKSDYTAYTKRIQEIESEIKPEGKHDISKLRSILSSGWRSVYENSSREERQFFWRNAIDKIIVFPDRTIEVKIV